MVTHAKFRCAGLQRVHAKRSQAGFTALELMMVLAIMLLVSSLAVPAAFSTMRYATFNKAISDMQALHNDARNRAMLGQPEAYPGVRWSNDNGVWTGVLLAGPNPVPGTERTLPGSIVLMGDNTTITADVEWWYQPGSGKLSAHSTSLQPAMVGMTAPELYLAPSEPTHIQEQATADGPPGLELSTRQGDLRAIIRVYPVGVMRITHIKGLDEEEETP